MGVFYAVLFSFQLGEFRFAPVLAQKNDYFFVADLCRSSDQSKYEGIILHLIKNIATCENDCSAELEAKAPFMGASLALLFISFKEMLAPCTALCF